MMGHGCETVREENDGKEGKEEKTATDHGGCFRYAGGGSGASRGAGASAGADGNDGYLD